MEEKILGKITSAEFGSLKNYSCLFGLHLSFHLSTGGGVCDGGKYSVNISPECKWSNESKRPIALSKMLDSVDSILKAAKVYEVSDLVGRPVEVILENNMFKDFRILTEVL